MPRDDTVLLRPEEPEAQARAPLEAQPEAQQPEAQQPEAQESVVWTVVRGIGQVAVTIACLPILLYTVCVGLYRFMGH